MPHVGLIWFSEERRQIQIHFKPLLPPQLMKSGQQKKLFYVKEKLNSVAAAPQKRKRWDEHWIRLITYLPLEASCWKVPPRTRSCSRHPHRSGIGPRERPSRGCDRSLRAAKRKVERSEPRGSPGVTGEEARSVSWEVSEAARGIASNVFQATRRETPKYQMVSPDVFWSRADIMHRGC